MVDLMAPMIIYRCLKAEHQLVSGARMMGQEDNSGLFQAFLKAITLSQMVMFI